MNTIKVAIVDNQELIRAALACLISREEMWEQGTRVEYARLIGQGGASIALVGTDGGLDPLAPLVDGGVLCIAYGSGGTFRACRAVLAGAQAYVSTSSAADDLSRVISAVARGERLVSAEVEQMLDDGGPAGSLTPREVQTLELLARGRTNREIADELQISVKTVDTHRSHLKTKLGLRNNADITRFAVRYGFAQV